VFLVEVQIANKPMRLPLMQVTIFMQSATKEEQSVFGVVALLAVETKVKTSFGIQI
jgi:hypothetical protein